MNNEEDIRFIEEYLSGNGSAFDDLVKKYLKSVYNFLRQMVNDSSQAEDLTQETFVKAWKSIGGFNRSKNFKTWLFVIAKNGALDYFKKKKTVPFSYFENVEGDSQINEIEDDAILVSEILEKKEVAKEIEEKLKQIPEEHRVILTLCYKEYFSLCEIAQILGKPYNTVKTYHRRALLSLKKVLLEK